MIVTDPVLNHLNKHLTLICFMWFQCHWLKFCLTVVDETYIIYIYIYIYKSAIYIYLYTHSDFDIHAHACTVTNVICLYKLCCSFTGLGEKHNFLARKKMLMMQVPVPSGKTVVFWAQKKTSEVPVI